MRSVRASFWLLAACLPAHDAVAQQAGQYLEVTVLDAGHADVVVIREPTGEVAMVDAGGGEVLRFLQRMRIDSLALLVATHPHPAHSGGIVDVLTARPVAAFVHGGGEGPLNERMLATLSRLEAVSPIVVSDTVMTLPFGDATVRVLPEPDTTRAGAASVGVIIEYGEFRVLLPGDADRDQLGYWLDSGRIRDVTVLKAPGHGGVEGVNRPFLAVARPEVVVVSVGDNPVGLPRAKAMTAYDAAAVDVFRTDRGSHTTVFGYWDGRYEVVRPSDLSAITPTGEVQPAPVADRPVERGTTADFSLISVDVEPGLPDSPEWDLNAEFVTIGNHGPSDIAIGGWQVCDLSTRCFRFPPHALLRAASTLRVHTGYGHTDGYAYFMNETRAVWNDNGDQATLRDAAGVIRGRHVY